ncbi:hydroxyacid dehydrogenase [Halomonas sp. KAO]|uniref:hydroxyacid dehydrogenase n=1 Tax=Halomonas sp. KAO TaxID=2783858 RepID=UPI00189E048E|nr:hydroxyacid dehydrogenase [Halomonas sp. KAO]MBF7053800.1 hydroxyacid dehydrogenase [Halomonas sp. KAO]
MRIVISEFMEQSAVERLSTRYATFFDPTLVESRKDLLRLLHQAQALLIRNRTQVDEELLDAAPNLRIVGRLGVGLDNIDVDLCQKRGINVVPAYGANSVAVAEYVICTAMMLLRKAFLHSDSVARGDWPRQELSGGQELSSKRLGIVGLGSIGMHLAKLGSALGMEVYATSRSSGGKNMESEHITFCSLDYLVTECDVISLHLPATEETYKLIDRSMLAKMKQGAILINSSRGDIVDEIALAECLHTGHLAGAALDVFSEEPLPSNDILATAPNLILTPHIAGLSKESNQRVSNMIAERVITLLGDLDLGNH